MRPAARSTSAQRSSISSPRRRPPYIAVAQTARVHLGQRGDELGGLAGRRDPVAGASNGGELEAVRGVHGQLIARHRPAEDRPEGQEGDLNG